MTATQTTQGRTLENKLIERILLMKKLMPNIDTAKLIVESMGPADLITATNVFAHCDNVKGFIEAAKYVLTPNGVLVLEFPYLVDFIEIFL